MALAKTNDIPKHTGSSGLETISKKQKWPEETANLNQTWSTT
jgi:hypothetical protein